MPRCMANRYHYDLHFHPLIIFFLDNRPTGPASETVELLLLLQLIQQKIETTHGPL